VDLLSQDMLRAGVWLQDMESLRRFTCVGGWLDMTRAGVWLHDMLSSRLFTCAPNTNAGETIKHLRTKHVDERVWEVAGYAQLQAFHLRWWLVFGVGNLWLRGGVYCFGGCMISRAPGVSPGLVFGIWCLVIIFLGLGTIFWI